LRRISRAKDHHAKKFRRKDPKEVPGLLEAIEIYKSSEALKNLESLFPKLQTRDALFALISYSTNPDIIQGATKKLLANRRGSDFIRVVDNVFFITQIGIGKKPASDKAKRLFLEIVIKRGLGRLRDISLATGEVRNGVLYDAQSDTLKALRILSEANLLNLLPRGASLLVSQRSTVCPTL